MKKLNKAQKTELEATIDKIDIAKGEAEELLKTLQNAYEDKTEKWQEGESGSALQEQIDNLGEVMDDLDNAMDKLRGVRDWESA